MATSDQRVSLRRYSHGKSNRVASIWVVSSMETLSTQSRLTSRDRQGCPRVWPANREGGSGIGSCRLAGETIRPPSAR